jgi:hypothetical protein
MGCVDEGGQSEGQMAVYTLVLGCPDRRGQIRRRQDLMTNHERMSKKQCRIKEDSL